MQIIHFSNQFPAEQAAQKLCRYGANTMLRFPAEQAAQK